MLRCPLGSAGGPGWHCQGAYAQGASLPHHPTLSCTPSFQQGQAASSPKVGSYCKPHRSEILRRGGRGGRERLIGLEPLVPGPLITFKLHLNKITYLVFPLVSAGKLALGDAAGIHARIPRMACCELLPPSCTRKLAQRGGKILSFQSLTFHRK